jgi:hypothetical protein
MIRARQRASCAAEKVSTGPARLRVNERPEPRTRAFVEKVQERLAKNGFYVAKGPFSIASPLICMRIFPL